MSEPAMFVRAVEHATGWRVAIRPGLRVAPGMLALVLGACTGSEDSPGTPVAARGAPADLLAAALEPVRAARHLPALAAAVVRADGTREVAAVGVRRLGTPVAVTAGDAWHLGSNTKAFTATLVARLVEQGRMDWSTTVEQALGARLDVHPGYREATVEQLLAHAGGVPHDFGPRPLRDRFRRSAPAPRAARLELVGRLLRAPPAYPPGTRNAYSNAGFVVAAAMVEELTGRSWEDLLEAEVLRPLGISTARIGAPGRAGATEQPWGHRDGLFGLVPVEPGPAADNVPAVAPSGGLAMSLADYGRFLAAHLAGEAGGSPLLRPATFRRLHADEAWPEYGLGWGVRHDVEWGRILVHEGSNGRWLHVVWAALDRGVGVVVATNSGNAASEQACQEALAALRPQPTTSTRSTK